MPKEEIVAAITKANFRTFEFLLQRPYATLAVGIEWSLNSSGGSPTCGSALQPIGASADGLVPGNRSFCARARPRVRFVATG